MASIDWTHVTKPSGTIDLVKAFEQLLGNLGEGSYFTDKPRALKFLHNLEALTEITNTGTASVAIVQALYIYDPNASLPG
jgi:hypothetical protein